MSRSTEILFNGTYWLAVLGNVQLYDWPWYRCRFQSILAFEPSKPLFDQELQLLEGEGADEEWFAAYEKIEGLALTLRYPSQAKSTELFLLHIDGEMARFKAVFG